MTATIAAHPPLDGATPRAAPHRTGDAGHAGHARSAMPSPAPPGRPRAGVGGACVRVAALALVGALLGGCAAMRSLGVDVASFGEWPATRAPGSYAFERLPSQAARADAAAALEDAATGALAQAGFKPAAPGAQPDVLVQVGARTHRSVLRVWDDPMWWHGGFGHWRHGPWQGPRFGWGLSIGGDLGSVRYESAVAVLLRDRASGQPLWEARASTETAVRADTDILAALFTAALADFPRTGTGPRRVTVGPEP